MPEHQVHQASYPTVDFVLDAIASWVNKYRNVAAAHSDFEQCSPDDVRQIAGDLGVPVSELRAISAKGPGSAELLSKMLTALRVDPEALAKSDPAVMRDLQRLCVSCGYKGRCQHELAKGTAAEHFHEFCPNAFTLDALFKSKKPAPR